MGKWIAFGFAVVLVLFLVGFAGGLFDKRIRPEELGESAAAKAKSLAN